MQMTSRLATGRRNIGLASSRWKCENVSGQSCSSSVHDLLCKTGMGWGLAHMDADEYHKTVLIRPRSREGLLRQPFRAGALRIR